MLAQLLFVRKNQQAFIAHKGQFAGVGLQVSLEGRSVLKLFVANTADARGFLVGGHVAAEVLGSLERPPAFQADIRLQVGMGLGVFLQRRLLGEDFVAHLAFVLGLDVAQGVFV